MNIFFVIGAVMLMSLNVGFAKVKVVTTTADISALVKEVGGDFIEVTSIAKGAQDPHFIEAKPSYMVKLRDADLLIANGLSLEVGWLPNLIRGARNPKINPGSKGYLELGNFIQPLDIPPGQVSRAMGDVHPDGNPHFMLDPVLVSDLSLKLAQKLGEIDPDHQIQYTKQAKSYQEHLDIKMKEWRLRVEKSGIKKVITHHPSLNYFLKTFNIQAPIHLEAKPGIPPSAQHILNVADTMKKQEIRHILVDSFFDTKIAERIAKEIPLARVSSVAISVDAKPGINKLEDVTEQLIKAIEAK